MDHQAGLGKVLSSGLGGIEPPAPVSKPPAVLTCSVNHRGPDDNVGGPNN